MSQIQDMKKQLQEATAMNEKNKHDLGVLEQEKQRLLNEVEENKKLLITKEEEIKKMTQEMDSLVNEINKINEELQKAVEEAKERETSDEKIKNLTTTIESLNKDLDSKAMTITQLMSELKTSTDVRSKLETTIQRLRKESETEREKNTERERLQKRKIEQLEETCRDREEELTKHVLDSRAEKEHLQEKIQGMQNTIDNIQKELTGRPAVVENRIQPELDDNAVMLTPGQKKPQTPISPIIQKKGGFLMPQKEPKHRDSAYNLFSDSSMEGDTLDASEVNRRFEALSRGERVSPMPLTALKRRGGVPAPHSSLKYRTPINNAVCP
ncbi:unnamed protein product [Danaus chrysippus]|uniref:(African queen) hypothetical protein n=1 Tax=Danaus chrysippus TaxID=151541 RepID=A0A8J2QT94_9NEOP|nr:unnamed protein product [Danaus chrysippus]